MDVTSYIFGFIWPYLANPTAMYVKNAESYVESQWGINVEAAKKTSPHIHVDNTKS